MIKFPRFGLSGSVARPKESLVRIPVVSDNPEKYTVSDSKVIPSMEFVSQMTSITSTWTSQSRRFHLRPSALVSLPSLVTIPFSTKQRYQTLGQQLHATLPVLESAQSVSILWHVDPQLGSWLLDSYSPLFDPFFSQKNDDHVTAMGVSLFLPNKPVPSLFEYLTDLRLFNRDLEGALKVIETPDEWSHILSLGLIPKLDDLKLLESLQEWFDDNPWPKLESIQLTGLTEEEECEQLSLLTLAHEPLETNDTRSLSDKLSQFYASRWPGLADQVKWISTGSPLADSTLQTSLFNAQDMSDYRDLLNDHFNSVPPSESLSFFQNQAKKRVAAAALVKSMMKSPQDTLVCLYDVSLHPFVQESLKKEKCIEMK